MMKIKVPVLVDIDTEMDGETKGGVTRNRVTGQISKGIVQIRKDALDGGEDLTSVVAHEFGHVIARLLKLPSHEGGNTTTDLELASTIFGRIPEPMVAEAVALEKDAWRIAHLMRLPIDPATERYGIASYETQGDATEGLTVQQFSEKESE